MWQWKMEFGSYSHKQDTSYPSRAMFADLCKERSISCRGTAGISATTGGERRKVRMKDQTSAGPVKAVTK